MKRNPTAQYEVAIIIGITGDEHTGVVVYSMKKYTAIKIVNSIIPDPEMMNDDNNYTDALGEFANMISGHAMKFFNQRGDKLTITTPTVLRGGAFEIRLLDQTTLSVNMMSPFGAFEINVAIKNINN